MYCIVLSMRLFSKEEWIWWSSFKNLHARGYYVPPSVDTGCFPWALTKPKMNRSAISMFLSLDIDSARICLFSGSIATHNHMNSDPTLSSVSSTMNSEILVLFDDIFFGWYFWIQFQIVTWFRLIQQDNLWDVLLSDKPEKYKYRLWYTYSGGVLFLVSTNGIRRLQAIDLSLSEQSRFKLITALENGSKPAAK